MGGSLIQIYSNASKWYPQIYSGFGTDLPLNDLLTVDFVESALDIQLLNIRKLERNEIF